MKTKKPDLRPYGINPAKGRNYEPITYVLALVFNLLQTRVGDYLARYNLSVVQFNILMLAAYQNGGKGLNQVEIAAHLIASASNITKLVEKSVQAGLLTRTTNPKSRRENIICITPKGQKLIDEMWPGYDTLVRELTEKIPSKDRNPFATMLQNWFVELHKEQL